MVSNFALIIIIIIIIIDLDNCTNGDIRLVNGSIDQEGRIEICANGVWGGICSSYGWDESDAFVICKQLGYADTGKLSKYRS